MGQDQAFSDTPTSPPTMSNPHTAPSSTNPMAPSAADTASSSFQFDGRFHVLPADRTRLAKLHLVHSNYVPAQVDRHLNNILMNEAGHMWLSASTLSGRYWTGSLWYYVTPPQNETVKPELSLTGTDTDHGITHILPYGSDDKQVLIGLDNGSLELHSLGFSESAQDEKKPSYYYLDRVGTFQEHDDIVSGLVYTSGRSQIVSASHDKNLVLWDPSSLAKLGEITNAHRDLILDLAAHPKESHTLASASLDGRVPIWDIREKKLAQVVYKDENHVPCAVQFVPDEDHFMVVGSRSGQLILLDTRKADSPLSAHTASFSEQIHQINFRSSSSGHTFAASADSNVLKIFGISPNSDLVVQKANKKHTDFVRGMAWLTKSDKDDSSCDIPTLLSCGWDQKICWTQLD
ncbi:hypothetical protein TCAL_01559 [Tigriopus californicus]|uniref:Uncharacterized protein n=1 Tax=Tigriopus californicus TaxID=6832 RepID=A0A553P746_TIGCA|nr:methylosome protein WDR77-like [Tigriopus californicus]TRY73506.1 hypothetical protein TCAL_01559 [Tigriopus californicus]|eukprot:TCALIF_01559-PA protein Name:"Similar to WDR77 Methylosome protein 50 (Pongo abelii)" AED:0.00 eAED:0.00 QI:162/1/1/1/1/1/6/113/403